MSRACETLYISLLRSNADNCSNCGIVCSLRGATLVLQAMNLVTHLSLTSINRTTTAYAVLRHHEGNRKILSLKVHLSSIWEY